MRARWVLHSPSPEIPIVGQARVATWWPGRYYFVSTIQLDSSSPLHRLSESIKQGVPYDEATLGPDRYVTQVFRCTRDGIVKSFAEPLYQLEYADELAARAGHKHTVDLLEQGRLKLRKVLVSMD
jgi:hypothetical protein